MWLEQYKVNVPENDSSDWRIRKFTVSECESMLSMIRDGNRYVPAGVYTKLVRGKTVVMSDTPSEIIDHLQFIHSAHGNVLVAGLGLGMVIQALLRKETVTHVTVVELSIDVINMVGDYYKNLFGDKLTIVNQSIFDYTPTEVFDFGWFDIWDEICSDNYEQMKRLNRKFGKSIQVKEHWSMPEIKRMMREEKKFMTMVKGFSR